MKLPITITFFIMFVAGVASAFGIVAAMVARQHGIL